MVRLFTSYLQNFRTEFNFPPRNITYCYPGHMGKALIKVRNEMKNVDCVIEVHDARIPKSGRNKYFSFITADRPHILVLNKMDLTDLSCETEIIKDLKKEGMDYVLFTSCRDKKYPGIKKMISKAIQLIADSDRYYRREFKDYGILIAGVPNVGKSSLINALRNIYMRGTKAAPVGAIPGVTRSVSQKIKVCEVPLIYVIDTPGVIEPIVSNAEAALKLALCSALQDHSVGYRNISDYLLFWLNRNRIFQYVSYMGLKEPTDDISELLYLGAIYLKKTLRCRNTAGGYLITPDTDFAARYFIKGFRTGAFGKIMLDQHSYFKGIP